MGILDEWQRLRRIELLVVRVKGLFFKPTSDNASWHTSADNEEISRLTNELFREVRGPYKPDNEEMAKFREGESK